MNHRTHVNFSRLYFPNLKTSEHERVTSIIDSPSRTAKELNKAVGTIKTWDPATGRYKEVSPYDYLGIAGKGHRRVNHDILTASLMTYYEVGPHAIGPTMVHLLLDDMSEEMKKRVGRAERDVWEAGINYKLEQMFKSNPSRYYYRHQQQAKRRRTPKPKSLVMADYSRTKPYYR
jgi:hypothetical protein